MCSVSCFGVNRCQGADSSAQVLQRRETADCPQEAWQCLVTHTQCAHSRFSGKNFGSVNAENPESMME